MSFLYDLRPKTFAYLGLCDGVGVQLDLAKVVARRDELVIVGPGARVQVRAVDRLGPDADRVEGKETRL